MSTFIPHRFRFSKLFWDGQDGKHEDIEVKEGSMTVNGYRFAARDYRGEIHVYNPMLPQDKVQPISIPLVSRLLDIKDPLRTRGAQRLAELFKHPEVKYRITLSLSGNNLSVVVSLEHGLFYKTIEPGKSMNITRFINSKMWPQPKQQ